MKALQVCDSPKTSSPIIIRHFEDSAQEILDEDENQKIIFVLDGLDAKPSNSARLIPLDN